MKNYNSKEEDLEEEDQRQDETFMVLELLFFDEGVERWEEDSCI
jgi:hypothetical protein